MTTPLVSYLVTVHNKRPYLADTLECIRAQARLAGIDYEIVCVDDLSTDGSLDFLREEGSRHSDLVVIANDRNLGPSVRINQAARAARGRYFIPMDADDFTPRNGARFFLDCADRYAVPLILGRARRGLRGADIPLSARVDIIDDPLAYCAAQQITHMGFFVASDLWRAAGGADESVFVQDQSLQLRLCAVAQRLARVHAVTYWLRPAQTGHLSLNVAQQHHDRFLVATHLLERQDISPRARRALTRQAISALWKLERDGGTLTPYLSRAFLRYVTSRVAPREISPEDLQAFRTQLARAPGVRRVVDAA